MDIITQKNKNTKRYLPMDKRLNKKKSTYNIK